MILFFKVDFAPYIAMTETENCVSLRINHKNAHRNVLYDDVRPLIKAKYIS